MQSPATINDLHSIEGKAELIGGRIVRYGLGEYIPCSIAGEIVFSLHEHEKRLGSGWAFTSGLAYVFETPLSSGRQSFAADASYYDGPLPTDPMAFIEGPPTFAVEVRSSHDYGPEADSVRILKRADYFEAGTLIVWDIDPSEESITSYSGDPSKPIAVFRRGDIANAGDAVPGWRLDVTKLFDLD